MISEKQKIKAVYYNNVNYDVPYGLLKHIDGFDIVEIEDNLYVCWDDKTKTWIKANEQLIIKYSKKRKVTLNYKGMTITEYINNENTFEFDNKKINKVKLEHFIEYDEDSNTWDILDIDSKKYDKFK